MTIVYTANGTDGNRFIDVERSIGHDLLEMGSTVDTGHWQAIKNVPNTKTIELTDVVLDYDLPWTMGGLVQEIQPNLPWAEDHFQERVAGQPTNPGDQYMNWPWYKPGWEAQDNKGHFSHTYQERYWPRYACIPRALRRQGKCTHGIRYRYGDLNDVVSLLAREPYTRQAILPVWFPEDTGAHHGGRVPCSLHYQFLLRDGLLNVGYGIRSCDFLRYFRDDVYMTCRLLQWVIERVTDESSDQFWGHVRPGNLHMDIGSLHVFEGDRAKMIRNYGEDIAASA